MANGDSFYPEIASDGRRVAFQSEASNLVPGDTNPVSDVFVADLGDIDGDGEWDPFDLDADGDGVTNAAEGECGDALNQDGDSGINDACPQVGMAPEGSGQCMDAIDNDGDGWINDGCIGGCGGGPGPPPPCERPICHSGAFNPASRPERTDIPGDDDGDGLVNEALPAGSEAYDCDGDGFSGALERYVFSASNTVYDQACANAWPPDIDNDGFSDISDLIFLTGNFGAEVPPAPVRYDIAPDTPRSFIDISDISRMLFFFGQGCA